MAVAFETRQAHIVVPPPPPVVPALKKLEKSTSSKSTSVLEGKLADGSDPLAVLDPALHSAGYLFVLSVCVTLGADGGRRMLTDLFHANRNARLGAADIDLATLIPFIMTFSETSDPTQLRLVPDLGEPVCSSITGSFVI